ncbi:MAG: hypothetical protein RLY86_666 [Pseudomonadota bacterium]|jgi:hypothetical protein
MRGVYLPPGTPPDLAAEHPRRARRPLALGLWYRRRWRVTCRRLLAAWLAWLDRRAGWQPGPDGRLRPPPRPLVPPAYLLALGQRYVSPALPRRRGLLRRVWAALLDRDN